LISFWEKEPLLKQLKPLKYNGLEFLAKKEIKASKLFFGTFIALLERIHSVALLLGTQINHLFGRQKVMDFLTSMKISSSGLNVQRKLMETVSSNLANIETTRTPEGGPYRRKELVVTALPLEDDFNEILKSELGGNVLQSMITEIIEDQSEPRLVFNPNHPDANETGYVAMPNVDLMTEMVNLITSTRGFEANVTAMNATKSMAQRAIELGR